MIVIPLKRRRFDVIEIFKVSLKKSKKQKTGSSSTRDANILMSQFQMSVSSVFNLLVQEFISKKRLRGMPEIMEEIALSDILGEQVLQTLARHTLLLEVTGGKEI